jgi:hypothetical protein
MASLLTSTASTPTLCGSFLVNKRSLVAFTWTLTTVLTLVAFITSVILVLHVHSKYKRLERYYEEQLYNSQYYNYQNGGGGEGGGVGEGGENNKNNNRHYEGHSADARMEEYLILSAMSSKSLAFTALYTMSLSIALSLYGSTAIVGFMSLRGDYIAPCFSSSPSTTSVRSSSLRVGIFGGAVILFANLLLLCAVIFGEVRVSEHKKRTLYFTGT